MHYNSFEPINTALAERAEQAIMRLKLNNPRRHGGWAKTIEPVTAAEMIAWLDDPKSPASEPR